ncbi:MAG TPA: hypothetical protein VMR96_10210 [Solirubrobacterales bacterium]|nr:hypothetical protein [Solirubrobacterales bacterium]
MSGFLTRVVADRVGGKRPAPPRAIGAAIAVGTTAGALTYRLLRHQSSRS